jgi:glucose/arabinose dehydrogenase
VVQRPGDARLFVVDQGGKVWSMPAGGGSHTEVLEVTGIATGGEQGLLSIAFHPDDPTRMFICYTDNNATNDVVVEEYDFPLAAVTVTPGPVATVIAVPHPDEDNHNGGMILFGPDGYLYVSLGDGGGGGDPFENGQDPDALLGSILRIDVDSLPYDIPATNPYADGQDGAPEVWIKGVRNPWRISFDGDDLYVADVGQGTREEMTVIDADSAGANLGWDVLEGTHCYEGTQQQCAADDFVDPTIEYSTHVSSTCAITGGYVYRGSEPDLAGIYFYGDYCQGNIRGLRMYKGALVDSRIFADDEGYLPGFGIDTAGRVYVTSFSTDAVYRIDLAS